MSETEELDLDTSSCCTNCGIAEIDDIKLKNCDDCDLVRYCSDECREENISQHEEECKKRADELRDGCCSNHRRLAILVTVRFVYKVLYRLVGKNLPFIIAAAK